MVVDVLLAAERLPGPTSLIEIRDTGPPRAARADAHREDVRVFRDASGDTVVILGRGLPGRPEVAVEVDAAAQNRGRGSGALVQARHAVGEGKFLFAQTAPGNSASLRALVAAGFRPIGSEILFFAE